MSRVTGARSVPGSWWTDWSAWLAPHAGELVAARSELVGDSAGSGRRGEVDTLRADQEVGAVSVLQVLESLAIWRVLAQQPLVAVDGRLLVAHDDGQ